MTTAAEAGEAITSRAATRARSVGRTMVPSTSHRGTDVFFFELAHRALPGTVRRMPTVEITTPDGVADALLVRPEGEPRGGVLFVMDAFGLRPRIEEMAERIAGEGDVGLAAD